MMKKGFLFTILAAALTMVWGCGGSDDDDNDIIDPPTTPTNEVSWTKVSQVLPTSTDWSGNEEKPDWTNAENAPDPADYESWMIIMVTLQEELAAYATEGDYMGVFINNSLRAIANPAITIGYTKDVSFILKVLGNEESDKSVPVTIKYYCAKLKQIFTLEGSEKFVPEKVYGVDEMLVLPFFKGCPKYPLNTYVTINFPKENPTFITPEIGDMMLVMVDGECRGVYVLDEHLFAIPAFFTAYCKREGETGNIYYYDSSENAFWNTGKTISLATDDSQTVDLTY